MHHGGHGFADELRGVVVDAVVHAGRKAAAHLPQHAIDFIGGLNRVAAGQLEYAHGNGVVTVHVSLSGVVARAEFHASNVPHACDVAFLARLDDHVAEFLLGEQTPLGDERVLKGVAGGNRRLAECAAGDL